MGRISPEGFSCLALSCPMSALPDHPRVTRHPSLGRSRSCADQANFARLSPGVGCCFRALAPSRSILLTIQSASSLTTGSLYLLPLPSLSLSHSLFGLRGSTRLCCQQVSRGSLTYSMLRMQREICLNPNYLKFHVYAIFRIFK